MRYFNAGWNAHRVGNSAVAIDRYVAALRYDPECAPVLKNLGVLLLERGSLVAAVACVRRALALTPDDSDLIANLGAILFRMEHYGAAIQAMERAIELDPSKHGYWHTLALASSVRKPEQARNHFDRAITLGPDDLMVQKHFALFELSLGKWREGFTRLERATRDERDGLMWFSGIPEWRGQDLTGKTIIVHYEQGFGDTIQFCRFVRQLKASFSCRTHH